MRVEPVGAFGETEIDPRCKCRQVHGNADDDGICRHCRPRVEAAQEARDEALGAALGAFMVQLTGIPDQRLSRVLEKLVEAVTETHHVLPDTCLLCGWTDGCKPDCAVLKLQELID
jgi:hypothetical protein